MPKENKEIKKTECCTLIKQHPGIIIALIISLTLLLMFGVWGFTKLRSPSYITVTGTYSQEIKNQIAMFNLTIEDKHEDKAVAVENVQKKSKEVVEQLKETGIPIEDIKTQNLNVYQREEPVVSSGFTRYEPGDWYASYMIEIKLRNLEQSDEVTTLLSSVEGASLWGPNLQVDDNKINEEELLAGAVEDARQKAGAIALKSNRKLGKVVEIIEGSSSYPNVYRMDYAKVDSMGVGGGSFPIEPGTSETTRTVTVTFRLR